MFTSMRPYLFVAALVAVVHAPILLMDGIYWDDWVLRQFLLDGDYGGHFLLWKELGLPGYAPIYWIIGNLGPNPTLAHNVVTLVLLVASSLLVFQIARRLGCSNIESGIIAVTAGIFPALETVFVFNNTVYLLMLTLFLAGVLTGLKGKRFLSLILFAVSFQHSSLLVFYGGFLGLIFFNWRRSKFPSSQVPTVLSYLLLPIVFFVVTKTLFPSVSYYNAFDLRLEPLIGGTAAFIDKGILEQLADIVSAVLNYPFAWAVTVAMGTLIWRKATPTLGKRSTLAIFLFGLVLFALAIAPYVAVSKAPRAHGYTTRHALLLAIPVGIVLMGYVRTLLVRGKRGVLVATIILATAYFGSLVSQWENDAQWQARWVKDRSIIQYFADHPELKRVSTFVMDDHFAVTPETYRFYEWSGMLRMAYGEPGRLGMYPHQSYEKIAEIGTFHPHWKEWYHVAGYPSSNCTTRVVIERGPHVPPRKLALTYLTKRFFSDEEDLRAFLRGVTEITVEPDAVTCGGGLS